MSDTDRPRYDPYTTQPRTLGELEVYARVAERAGIQAINPAMACSPVALDAAACPALRTLTAYIAAAWGTKPTPETVRKLCGQYCLARGVTAQQAKAASLQDVADALVPRTDHPPAARSEQAGAGRDRSETPGATAPPEQTDPVSRAIALMLTWEREGRKYTVKDLAKAAGTSKAALYRYARFKDARKAMKASGNAPSEGHKGAEKGLEAYDPEDEDDDC
jgi:hypothetical protein